MHLYVRADADGKIGTGHIMRCIALAQAWQDQGGKVTFISHCESDALRQRIIDEGFDFIAIDKSHPNPSDLGHTLEILKQLKTQNSKLKTWVILDGYHFTPEYQKSIRDKGYRLMVIDDMNHLPQYHADILLNQNIHAPELTYHCDEDTTMLMGTQYVLLRREFLKYRNFTRQIPVQARNILVTLGGADPDNVTIKVIEALMLLEEPDISVKILVGPANPHQKTLRKAIGIAHFKTELLIKPPNMPELMAWADLAISAGGSTCWELAFMGVPSLTVVIAENQRDVAKGLERAEIFKTVGLYKAMNDDILVTRLSALVRDKKQREKKSRLGRQLIDGKGAKNIVHALSEQFAMKH